MRSPLVKSPSAASINDNRHISSPCPVSEAPEVPYGTFLTVQFGSIQGKIELSMIRKMTLFNFIKEAGARCGVESSDLCKCRLSYTDPIKGRKMLVCNTSALHKACDSNISEFRLNLVKFAPEGALDTDPARAPVAMSSVSIPAALKLEQLLVFIPNHSYRVTK